MSSPPSPQRPPLATPPDDTDAILQSLANKSRSRKKRFLKPSFSFSSLRSRRPISHSRASSLSSDDSHEVRVDDGLGHSSTSLLTTPPPETAPPAALQVESDELSATQSTDTYKWAVLYENQRGITLFSVPYYSAASLLPADPAPFTLPGDKSDLDTTTSLRDYPLPDARWRWVSKSWMVDMRGDGEVQHDGFEYNWAFRAKGWRPSVGSFNAGGWVRRRRWIRLMMCPAPTSSSHTSSSRSSSQHSPASLQNESPLSGHTTLSKLSVPHRLDWDIPEEAEASSEHDWAALKDMIRSVGGSDGRKLAAWAVWLGLDEAPHHKDEENEEGPGSGGQKQSGDSDVFVLGRLERDRIIPVLREHTPEILRMFIHPSMREAFLAMLNEANISVTSASDSRSTA
ncbi:hypothetical protein BOTBODRAFT_566890 [Botryobasidium botryosum FD-172 SS1]|uniref:TECPR1-like DysF domain-containing protein n=1 Tax=Botryobasidium botryosum (strain FD-172 SS1) TaxID=930990 RepID=A0A067M9F5_BOTB1|nr:hypothetical protein BOTBODRAFT_566890 [Botryobasidium botryosum FD-172 SS1]